MRGNCVAGKPRKHTDEFKARVARGQGTEEPVPVSKFAVVHSAYLSNATIPGDFRVPL